MAHRNLLELFPRKLKVSHVDLALWLEAPRDRADEVVVESLAPQLAQEEPDVAFLNVCAYFQVLEYNEQNIWLSFVSAN